MQKMIKPHIQRASIEEVIAQAKEDKEQIIESKTKKSADEIKDSGPSVFPSKINGSFILSYNAFGKELIAKSNELFAGTKAEIPLLDAQDNPLKGEVQKMYILKRLALITTLHKYGSAINPENLWPITPEQSEVLLKEGKLPNPTAYWEDLALLLYDTSSSGNNPFEANVLYESIEQHRHELGLSKSDLSSKLVVVNAGLKKEKDAPHGVSPIILPGITQVYSHEVLEKVGPNQDCKFDYGLTGGLPLVSELFKLEEKGKRTLYMPSEIQDIGLRVLIRDWKFVVSAWGRVLVFEGADGRVNFALQGAKNLMENN